MWHPYDLCPKHSGECAFFDRLLQHDSFHVVPWQSIDRARQRSTKMVMVDNDCGAGGDGDDDGGGGGVGEGKLCPG